MNTPLAMLRRADWFDEPSDFALFVIVTALVLAVHYFLKKYFPQASPKMLKVISSIIMLVVMTIWYYVVGT